MPISFFSNSNAGVGGSAVPFQRIVEPAQLGLFLNLEQAELMRIQRYNEAWRFYYGKHWSFQREDGEPLVTLNYYRKFIDKHAEFLMGKGFVINTHEAMEHVTKPYLDEVWKYNNRERLAWDIAIMGGATGDAFILVTDQEPTEIQKKVNPFSQGRTRINLLGSEQVFPSWDPLNIDVLTSVRIETIYYADRLELDRNHGNGQQTDGRQLHTKRFTQIITPNQILEQYHGEVPIVKANPLGEIPLVHIQNLSVPREYYGMSDGQDLIDLNRELNEKSTDISDTINYHSAPITVITGAKAKNLERGPRQIWSGLPKDAAVFNLKLEGDLSAAQAYWDRIKKVMHEIGDTPEGVLGERQPISNTSGVALHIQYQPIVARAKRKRATYETGLQQINYFILRIGMVTGRIQLPYDICRSCGGRILKIEVPGQTTPVWNPDLNDYVDQPLVVKRCYHIDKQTLDFMDPLNMRVKIWREYGFGGEMKEVPLDQARQIARGARSFWDYAYLNLDEMERYEDENARIQRENFQLQSENAENPPQPPQERDAEGNIVPTQPQAPQPLPPPPPPRVRVRRIPVGDVNVPEEPEEVTVHEPLIHPMTGQVLRYRTKNMFLVPTGCKQPQYLNPYETEVTCVDVLPKDDALQAQLYGEYQQRGWVDEEWVRAKIPEIAVDAVAIKKRLQSKATSGMPTPWGAAMVPGAPAAPAVTDLAPAPQQLATVPGPGGNPVPQGAAQ